LSAVPRPNGEAENEGINVMAEKKHEAIYILTPISPDKEELMKESEKCSRSEICGTHMGIAPNPKNLFLRERSGRLWVQGGKGAGVGNGSREVLFTAVVNTTYDYQHTGGLPAEHGQGRVD